MVGPLPLATETPGATEASRAGTAHRRRQGREATIAAATARLLQHRRWGELTVDDVAREAGMSRTAFYRFFGDLGAVLIRLLADVSDEIARGGRDFWFGRRLDAPGLLGAAATVTAVFRRHSALIRALADAGSVDDELDRTYRDVVERFVEATAERIRRDQAAGTISDRLDPVETAHALVWMTERYLSAAFRRDVPPDDQTAGRTLFAVWWRTLYGPADPPDIAPG